MTMCKMCGSNTGSDSYYCPPCASLRVEEAVEGLTKVAKDIAMTLKEIRMALREDRLKKPDFSVLQEFMMTRIHTADLMPAFGIDYKKEMEALLREHKIMPPTEGPDPKDIRGFGPITGCDPADSGLPACSICGKSGGH